MKYCNLRFYPLIPLKCAESRINYPAGIMRINKANSIEALPVEVSKKVAAANKDHAKRLLAIVVEVSDKAVKAAEQRVDENIRTMKECREQAERELADALQTMNDLNTRLDNASANTEELENRLAESKTDKQAQAIKLAQMSERLVLIKKERKRYELQAEQMRSERDIARENADKLRGLVEKLQAQIKEPKQNLFSETPKRISDVHFSTVEQSASYILIKKGRDAKDGKQQVGDLYFAKYPLTNKLYRKFIAWLQLAEKGQADDILKDRLFNLAKTIPGFQKYLGKNPELSKQFRSEFANNPRFNGVDQPVVGVNWYAARTYCLWLSLMESSGQDASRYRLPTSPEWEYAAAGKEKRKYPWEANKGKPNLALANYSGHIVGQTQSVGQTTPVGSYPEGVTPEGLFDMAGNVWEWSDSWWDGTHSRRVIRGGGWDSGSEDCLSAHQGYGPPGRRYNFVGFRLVSCSQPALLDSPMEQPLQDTTERAAEFDSSKEQFRQIKIRGLQGGEISFEFCPIPAGTFRMESNEVKIDQDFYLGKYPVTQQQWKSVMGNNPSYFKGESLPVEKVSHDDVQAFIQKLNTLSGKQHYRLPTEAEWEYACRAESSLAYFFGDSARLLGKYAWYGPNSGKKTHPVGKKSSNEWGLYDMTGNVWEWTGSWYDSSCLTLVIRGGSWFNEAKCCQSAFRNKFAPGNPNITIGFRLVYVQ